MSARERVAAFWDDAVGAFLDGNPWSDELRPWMRSYNGSGDGVVDPAAFPEPYLGSLDREPAMIFLALNPGRAYPEFQYADGIFADEIRQLGSYRAWAATWPYLRDPWVSTVGRNRHHSTRLTFMQRWHGDPALTGDDMLAFELYPWHSTRVTAAMAPSPKTVHEFVWEPIAELSNPLVFAFGLPWFAILIKQPGLRVIAELGAGGRPYPTRVPSRSVIVLESDTGALVVAERHLGSAGPPSGPEVELLRSELEPFTQGLSPR